MRNYIILSLMVSCFLIITGCGGEGGLDLGPGGCVSVPYDGNITIQPGDKTLTFGGGVGPFSQTFEVTITAFNEAGFTLSDVLVWIDFDWAEPSPVATVQFYDGNTPKNAPMNACTGVDGTYQLKIQYDGGCGEDYFGDLIVRSGSVYADKWTLTIKGAECGT